MLFSCFGLKNQIERKEVCDSRRHYVKPPATPLLRNSFNIMTVVKTDGTLMEMCCRFCCRFVGYKSDFLDTLSNSEVQAKKQKGPASYCLSLQALPS
jgi:hypothetical protein